MESKHVTFNEPLFVLPTQNLVKYWIASEFDEDERKTPSTQELPTDETIEPQPSTSTPPETIKLEIEKKVETESSDE